MKILLIRHGETIANAKGILQGHSPGKLNTKGIKQAEKVGITLKDNDIDLIISSDLERSRHTADIIRQYINKSHIQDSLIREKDWGSYTGQYTKDVDISNPPLDAETDSSIYSRAVRFINKLKNKHGDETILIVGHGIINQALMAALQDIPFQKMKDMEIQQNTDLWIWE